MSLLDRAADTSNQEYKKINRNAVTRGYIISWHMNKHETSTLYINLTGATRKRIMDR